MLSALTAYGIPNQPDQSLELPGQPCNLLLSAWDLLQPHFWKTGCFPVAATLAPLGFRKFCLQPQWKGHSVLGASTYRAGGLAERAAGKMGLARG